MGFSKKNFYRYVFFKSIKKRQNSIENM